MGLLLVSPVSCGKGVLETICNNPRLYSQLKIKILHSCRKSKGSNTVHCIVTVDLSLWTYPAFVNKLRSIHTHLLGEISKQSKGMKSEYLPAGKW